jgi:hypothetical protein
LFPFTSGIGPGEPAGLPPGVFGVGDAFAGVGLGDSWAGVGVIAIGDASGLFGTLFPPPPPLQAAESAAAINGIAVNRILVFILVFS